MVFRVGLLGYQSLAKAPQLHFYGLFGTHAAFYASDCAPVLLQQVPLTHPFANLEGSDNIITFKTQRYSEQALVIRGPGAGAEVTAAGVFADLLHVAKTLGLP